MTTFKKVPFQLIEVEELTDEDAIECAKILGWSNMFYNDESLIPIGREKVKKCFITNEYDLATYEASDPTRLEKIYKAFLPFKIIKAYQYLQSRNYKLPKYY